MVGSSRWKSRPGAGHLRQKQLWKWRPLGHPSLSFVSRLPKPLLLLLLLLKLHAHAHI
jgi:hypothetical protein